MIIDKPKLFRFSDFYVVAATRERACKLASEIRCVEIKTLDYPAVEGVHRKEERAPGGYYMFELWYLNKMYELHQQLWNWIADEAERTGSFVDKVDAFEHFQWPHIACLCWGCEYAALSHRGCDGCLLQWEYGQCELDCFYDATLYEQWRGTHDWKEAVQLAREIANLPKTEERGLNVLELIERNHQ